MLPINITELLEHNRIGYKRGWIPTLIYQLQK